MTDVAIILRTKDRPVLLARALASILSQRQSNWFVCLINDGGSKERVDAAVAPFVAQFRGRLRIIHNDASRGMEAASNQAVDATESRYLVVHDDDDSWHPDFLSETVDFLDREDNQRFCGVVTWSELVREQIDDRDIHTLSRRPDNNWYHHVDLHRFLGGNIFPPICFLFRREIIDRVGRFNESMPVLGDWDFSRRCLLEADIAVLPKILAYYHQRVDLPHRDIYSNSIHADQSLHTRVNIEMRNGLLRRHLMEHPHDLGSLAAVSRDFVQVVDRLNEVEKYLASQSARVIERLNQVESYLAHRIVEQEARHRAELDRVSSTSDHIQRALRPAHYLKQVSRPVRRLIRHLRGRP